MGDPTDSENETKSKGPQPVRNSRKWALTHHLGKVAVVLFCGVFLLIFFWKHMFPLVGPGEAGVMFYRFFGGTQTDAVVGEGQKFIFSIFTMCVSRSGRSTCRCLAKKD